jgi:hypothetical protein
MDAQVGNVLLTGSDPALAADQRQDLALYASDEQHAEQDLQRVAVTAAADPAAQRAVSSVLDALGRYQALAADAIVVNQRGNDPAGRPSAATLSYFQQATDLMNTTVLPAATSLTTVNASALDTSYNQDRSLATSGQVLGLAVAGALLGNVGIFSYDAALAADIRAYQADSADVRFGGYLGTEFRNITFTGERAAAARALLAYQVYEKYDRKLRAMAKTNLAQAIAFDIGTSPGQSDWAFNQWDGALRSVITINENAFTAAILDGQTTGSPWVALIPAMGTALIAALAVAGTRPRLAEYR